MSAGMTAGSRGDMAGTTRVYLPATLSTLADAQDAGGFGPGHAAHAVTGGIREWYVEGDQEELEYAAFSEAAEASLRLLAAEIAPADHRAARRVVIAADVAADCLAPPPADSRWRSEVRLTCPVPLSAVASVHVDDDEARAVVREAVYALPAADSGDDDAQFALDEAESHELLWYDVTEIADLI